MISIFPDAGSEAYETIKQLEMREYKFEGMGFFVTNIGFRGWLRAISPDGLHWVKISLSGRDEATWKVETEKEPEYTGEPDPCDLAREYNEDALYGEQPTPYDR